MRKGGEQRLCPLETSDAGKIGTTVPGFSWGARLQFDHRRVPPWPLSRKERENPGLRAWVRPLAAELRSDVPIRTSSV